MSDFEIYFEDKQNNKMCEVRWPLVPRIGETIWIMGKHWRVEIVCYRAHTPTNSIKPYYGDTPLVVITLEELKQ